ncbi:uncharacterized protein LOC133194834 [Saccostrea echinata]|uniref:uncharacterized protein LOC133194834 n=1 Tax=Saccostrea echinata TaxID=191078 RepID=UPI002A831947|nr:uncharacterized protein LOC133194834 [Saccostrea echinata]XP_061186724.1 uncharacterized protein LOC133194834 [Saccostrea echinata]
MLWKPLLVVLVIFVIKEGTTLSETFDKNNDEEALTGDQDSLDFVRHRVKRSILGPEFHYFRIYYTALGLLNDYNRLLHRGIIRDWRPLGSSSYHDAIFDSTLYYRSEAMAGRNVDLQVVNIVCIIIYRRQDAIDHGGGDWRHNLTTSYWKSGLEQIQDGQSRYREEDLSSKGSKREQVLSQGGFELKQRSIKLRGPRRRHNRGRLRRSGRRHNRGRARRILQILSICREFA